jgi:hypothetical protein
MNFRNFIATQWHDIKGNAKWSFICATIAAIPAIVRFVAHAPIWEVLAIFVITFVALSIFIWLISKIVNQSELEIEGVPIDIASAQYHQCQLRIYNKSSTKAADNVKVELIALNDGLENDQAAKYFRPKFPVFLKPEVTGENTINPEASIKFNLFRVTMNVKSAILKDGVAVGWEQKFIALFGNETTKDVTLFSWKKPYRLKLIATARDFKKVEREFDLIFTDEGSFCRFVLNRVDLK